MLLFFTPFAGKHYYLFWRYLSRDNFVIYGYFHKIETENKYNVMGFFFLNCFLQLVDFILFLVEYVVFCSSLFVLLSLFFWRVSFDFLLPIVVFPIKGSRSTVVEASTPSITVSMLSVETESIYGVFSGVRVTRSLVLCVCFVGRCLSFFFWPLCCLFFFDLRFLITPLMSSNSSYT